MICQQEQMMMMILVRMRLDTEPMCIRQATPFYPIKIFLRDSPGLVLLLVLAFALVLLLVSRIKSVYFFMITEKDFNKEPVNKWPFHVLSSILADFCTVSSIVLRYGKPKSKSV